MKNIKDLTFYQKRILVCIKNGWYEKFNKIRKNKLDLSSINFYNLKIKMNLKHFNFSGSDFRGSYFSGSNFSGSNFSGSDFRDSNFRDSNFSGSYFRRSNFSDSDFSHVKGIKVISICGIGSEKRKTLYFWKMDKIFCGCFSGTLKQFKIQISETYKEDDFYYKQYQIAVEYFEKQLELFKSEDNYEN